MDLYTIAPKHIQWAQDGFRLTLTRGDFSYGRYWYSMTLCDNGVPIFAPAPFPIGTPCALVAGVNDTRATFRRAIIASALGFLSCQSGDTDEDYFDAYTDEQHAWAASYRAETLAGIASDIDA
jgi:hypothetical protein